jgi:hypothetical protein
MTNTISFYVAKGHEFQFRSISSLFITTRIFSSPPKTALTRKDTHPFRHFKDLIHLRAAPRMDAVALFFLETIAQVMYGRSFLASTTTPSYFLGPNSEKLLSFMEIPENVEKLIKK